MSNWIPGAYCTTTLWLSSAECAFFFNSRTYWSDGCCLSDLQQPNVGRRCHTLRSIEKVRVLDQFSLISLGRYLVWSRIRRVDVYISRMRNTNSAARLITLSKKHEHITPVLYDLHWLPVHQRTKFKILLLTYKILHDRAPSYLSDLITRRNPVRSLRSCAAVSCFEPRFGSECYGGRAFSVVANRLWNSLPPAIRNMHALNSFKTALKTHLFNEHYK